MNEVRHNEHLRRFEAGEAPHLAKLNYRMKDGALDLLHVEVPEQYQGQGLAGKLASTALEWARSKGVKVIPSCPYVKGYLAKHPEYADLV
ncbi:MAG: N-acetyltransferase [Acidobacteriota bacterium]|nr:N-acetyltransferase [Acidobacteriota bacterium]